MSATRITTGRTSSTATAASCTAAHFGLSVRDRLDLARLALTPEAMLDGRRIDEFFRADFFATEFWLLWTTIMGPLPQHSAMEMRRYMNRFLPLLPDLSVMSHVLRTPLRPIRGDHRTVGGVAAPAWCDLPDGHVRPRHRLRAIVRQRHGQPARLRTRISHVHSLPQLAAGNLAAPTARRGRRDEKEKCGVSIGGSVAGIPGLKSETWGTLRFHTLTSNCLTGSVLLPFRRIDSLGRAQL